FITILRMKPYSSPSLCVATLAVVDNLCLLVKLLLLQLTKNDVNLGVYGCKTLYYLGNAFAIFANWILVLMTIERFLAIWFPLKIGRLCTQYKDFIELTWFLVDGAFYAIIPCALLIVFNSLIVWGISRAAVVQRSLTHDARSGSSKSLSNQAAEKVRQQRQITIMLLVVCVTFILLIMPNCVFFIYKGHWDHDDSLIFLLSDLTHAVNFFVYFISTKKFRDRFLDTVCFCKRWQRRQFARSWTTAQSQMSETGSIYVTSSTNGGHQWWRDSCELAQWRKDLKRGGDFTWQRRQFARSWTTAQFQMSETGSIYVTSSTNGGVIPLSLHNKHAECFEIICHWAVCNYVDDPKGSQVVSRDLGANLISGANLRIANIWCQATLSWKNGCG
ncbi:hypothetical protein BaRGS_00038522, partial [Batillaria attramentaria]